jgi:hypothetical protein
LREPFLMIRHLIEGAVYQIEVEASGKCDGEIGLRADCGSHEQEHLSPGISCHRRLRSGTLDSHAVVPCNAGADGEELAGERTQRTGETTSRSLTKEVLQPESMQQRAAVARGVAGVFGEEPGAEVRRGFSESDREEWWGRNLDDFSRQALEDQKLNDDAISSRLTQRALPADGTNALSGPQCPQCTPVAAAGTPVCLLYLYNVCLCPYLIYIYISIYICCWAGAAGSAKSSKKRAFSLSKMPKLMLPAKEDEIGRRIAAPWTGEHVSKTLDRYASVLRDRRTAHSIDIQLPKYCSDRVVSKQVCSTCMYVYRLGCYMHTVVASGCYVETVVSKRVAAHT